MRLSLLILVIFINCVQITAQNPRGETKPQNVEHGFAIHGYDPVAYHTQNKAVKGDASFHYTYNSVNYQFSSEVNKLAFIEDPVKYIPQFGGWCAYAMGVNGELVDVDPATFKIVDGKLLLFYNANFNNTLVKWNKNETVLYQNAIINWNNL